MVLMTLESVAKTAARKAVICDAQERRTLLKREQESAKAIEDYQAKELATRLLTAKLRAERLARASKSGGKP